MSKIVITLDTPKKEYRVGDLFRIAQSGDNAGVYMLVQVTARTYTLVSVFPASGADRGNRWADPIQLEWGDPLDAKTMTRLVGVNDGDTWEYIPCTITEEN